MNNQYMLRHVSFWHWTHWALHIALKNIAIIQTTPLTHTTYGRTHAHQHTCKHAPTHGNTHTPRSQTV